MKAKLKRDGFLEITAETDVEAYALEVWLSKLKLDPNRDVEAYSSGIAIKIEPQDR